MSEEELRQQIAQLQSQVAILEAERAETNKRNAERRAERMAKRVAGAQESQSELISKQPQIAATRYAHGPLAGCRVVECTHFIAGPLSGRLLADQGAEVIKVEPDRGDPYRFNGETVASDISPDFHLTNRGKKSVVLNTRNEAGLEVFKMLLKHADVFLTNYRPGVLESWGCGYEAIKQINPHIIFCVISGYGQTGPYSKAGCFDTAIQALSGLAHFQGTFDRSDGSLPVFVQDAIFDKATAYTVKDALTAALYARDVKGKGGQLIEVSLLEAGQSFFWTNGMKGHTFFDKTSGTSIGGHRFRWDIQHVGYSERREDGYGNKDVLTPDGSKKSAYAVYVDPLVGAPVTKMSEVHKNPQVIHNKNIIERSLYEDGQILVREPKPAARFMGTPAADVPGVAPHLGEHTMQVLHDLGLSKDEVQDLASRGAFGYASRL